MQRAFVRWVIPLLLLMPASVSGQTDQEIEDLFWRSVECESARQVQAYLEVYPNGVYVAEAQACLEQQRLQTDREIEDVFWRSVECKSRLQVQAYLEVYPTGRYIAEAWACLEGQLGLNRAARVLVQQGLAAVGHDPGPADGLFGGAQTRTRRAIRAWQAAKGMAETGYLTREQADTLMALGQEAEEAERAAQAQAEQAAQEESARQARAIDDAAYAQAQRLDTAAAYADYLRAYPTGQHVQEARARQIALQEAARHAQEAARRAQADDAAYAAAERADTAEGYEEYLQAYPQGRHAAEARRQQQRRWRAGQTFSDELRSGGKGPEMVVVPAGSFQMGCVSGLYCADEEQPVHRVTFAQSFAAGKYEVTFAEWDGCVASGGCRDYRPGDKGWGRGRRPVIYVSWEDAQAYVKWLSEETGQAYRLLSEAEWEYVARAGKTTLYSWGDSIGQNQATCYRCGSQWDPIGFLDIGGQTAPVGSFAANGWGLHDVNGNVWEWVQDCWNEGYAGAPSDGRAWESGDCRRRIQRGGAWTTTAWDFRLAYRAKDPADNRNKNSGFRIARSLD